MSPESERRPLFSFAQAFYLLILFGLLFANPHAARAISDTDPFSLQYQSGSTSSCGSTFDVSGGVYPAEPGAYPVVIFTPGTTLSHRDADALAIVEYMARRGFVAATANYPNENFQGCSTFRHKAGCLYGDTGTTAVSNLCNLPNADCSKGILVVGFSQGSVMATLANNHDSRIRAAYGMGISTDYGLGGSTSCVAASNRILPGDRIRAVNGESDGIATTDASHLNEVTGQSCGSGDTDCWRPNRSGWRLVQDAEVVSGESADHCYMRTGGSSFAGGCGDNLDANWRDGSDSWTMSTNLDWLATFADPPTVIVDDDGRAGLNPVNCSATGTSDTAFTTIQEAIRRLPPPRVDNQSGTVVVCPGTYEENISIDTPGVKLHSSADSIGTVVKAADTTQPVLTVSNATNVSVRGFTLHGGLVRFSGVRHVLFQDNRLDSNAQNKNLVELLDSDTNILRGNFMSVRRDTGLLLVNASSNFVVDNRIVETRFGIALAKSSDSNVFRDNRIDTHFVGISIHHDGRNGPRGNLFQRNTIRSSNTGIVINGRGRSGNPNVAENNNIASNFEGIENITVRIFDARNNWWGDPSGPGNKPGEPNRDPFTGVLADGQGDSIVSVNASGVQGPDTNVAFDPWLDTQAVDVRALPDIWNGCLIQRLGVPDPVIQWLRDFRDSVLFTRAGRFLTRRYY